MLCLTRKVDETIHIGENITIQVIRVDRGNVRIGIQAPRDVPILRGELNAPLHLQQERDSVPEHSG